MRREIGRREERKDRGEKDIRDKCENEGLREREIGEKVDCPTKKKRRISKEKNREKWVFFFVLHINIFFFSRLSFI